MKILILGAGPAGLYCARELYQKLGSSVDVILADPKLDTPRHRVATPILVPIGTLKRFNSKYEQQSRLIEEGKYILGDKAVDVKKIAKTITNKTKVEFLNPITQSWGAPDYFDLVEDLHAQVTSTPIQMTPAKVVNVEVRNSRADTILLEHQSGTAFTLQPDMVIDASGRDAPIAQLLNNKQPETISQKQYPKQASLIISGYFTIDQEATHKLFEDLGNTIYMHITKKGLYLAILPVLPMSNSDATHLVLVEGDKKTLTDIHLNSSKQSNLSMDQKFMQTFLTVTKNTPLGSLISAETPLYRPMMFNYRGGVMRSTTLTNYAMVGDALFNANPLFSQGMRWVADSSTVLVDLLQKCAHNVPDTCQSYSNYFKTDARGAMRNYNSSYMCLKAIMKFRRLFS